MVRETFEALGGTFVLPAEELQQKLSRVRAYLFDWDGVFNDGSKTGSQGSVFSEQDSMGTNLLRLGHWLHHDRTMPVTGIITGAVNAGVDYFAQRESIDICIRGFTNKRDSWDKFLAKYDLQEDEVAFIYDDVLDLPIAARCGVRFYVQRPASPGFRQYILRGKMCDYITAHSGGHGAVREVCELILMLNGHFGDTVNVRVAYDETYQAYLRERGAIRTEIIAPGSS